MLSLYAVYAVYAEYAEYDGNDTPDRRSKPFPLRQFYLPWSIVLGARKWMCKPVEGDCLLQAMVIHLQGCPVFTRAGYLGPLYCRADKKRVLTCYVMTRISLMEPVNFQV